MTDGKCSKTERSQRKSKSAQKPSTVFGQNPTTTDPASLSRWAKFKSYVYSAFVLKYPLKETTFPQNCHEKLRDEIIEELLFCNPSQVRQVLINCVYRDGLSDLVDHHSVKELTILGYPIMFMDMSEQFVIIYNRKEPDVALP